MVGLMEKTLNTLKVWTIKKRSTRFRTRSVVESIIITFDELK